MKAKKVLFTGPESSGKTTIAQWAADAWKATYVEEYARTYLQGQGQYAMRDLLRIAQRQLVLERLAARKGNLIFCDTSLLVIQVWMLEKFNRSIWDFGFDSEHLFSFDQVYLCRPDIPWQPDTLRENPLDRERLFDNYRDSLDFLNLNYRILEGSESKRQDVLCELIA